jgi:NADH:ubiquinone oxidoreductase subunit 6 (subunit J)
MNTLQSISLTIILAAFIVPAICVMTPQSPANGAVYLVIFIFIIGVIGFNLGSEERE